MFAQAKQTLFSSKCRFLSGLGCVERCRWKSPRTHGLLSKSKYPGSFKHVRERLLVNHKTRQAVSCFIGALTTDACSAIPMSIEDAASRHGDAASKTEISKDFWTLVLQLLFDNAESCPDRLAADVVIPSEDADDAQTSKLRLSLVIQNQ